MPSAGCKRPIEMRATYLLDWHGYGRSRPIRYFAEPTLLSLAVTVMGEVTAHRINITEQALLSLSGTVMGDIGAHMTFHGAIITVVTVVLLLAGTVMDDQIGRRP